MDGLEAVRVAKVKFLSWYIKSERESITIEPAQKIQNCSYPSIQTQLKVKAQTATSPDMAEPVILHTHLKKRQSLYTGTTPALRRVPCCIYHAIQSQTFDCR